MVNPIKAVGRAIDPVLTAVTRAVTIPGTNQTAPTPTVPDQAPAATTPTAKPAKKGIQQSFLSGVAASNLSGQAGGTSGKTLLGA
jgi:hypothetical protein